VEPLRFSGIHRYLLKMKPNKHGRYLQALFLEDRTYVDLWLRRQSDLQSYLDGLRVIVACRLYEMRHGQRPETLQALVPELLAAVPSDPFDGQPLRYVPEGRGVCRGRRPEGVTARRHTGIRGYGCPRHGRGHRSRPLAGVSLPPAPVRRDRYEGGDLVYRLILSNGL